jgi:uncharacterized Fe-S cluster-containing protein
MSNKEEDEGEELFIDESDRMEGKKSFRILNPKPNSRSVSEYFNNHKALIIKKVVRFRSRKVTAPIRTKKSFNILKKARSINTSTINRRSYVQSRKGYSVKKISSQKVEITSESLEQIISPGNFKTS